MKVSKVRILMLLPARICWRKSWIVERKSADCGSRHAGLSMEIFGRIQQEAAQLFLSGKFEIFTAELELDRTRHQSPPASLAFSYGRIVD
jgi:hypothetical protein